MGENVDINRFALTAVLTAAGAKRPSEYPDFETLNAMSDAALVAYAEGLLYSLEHSLQPRDSVARFPLRSFEGKSQRRHGRTALAVSWPPRVARRVLADR
jgi:hypothetical protein